MEIALAYRAQAALALHGQELFPTHGPRNGRLGVEVIDAGVAADVRTFVVVLPWGLEGLIFVPDERFPTSLLLGGRRLRIFRHDLEELGSFRTVELVDNVTPLASPHHARKVANLIAPSFREAAARARRELFGA